jgi:hypothetical protein
MTDIPIITRRRSGGKEAMDEMGVLPEACGVLLHDHWKAYYSYESKTHGLCNAHHVRELTAAKEAGLGWAQGMIDFLLDLNGGRRGGRGTGRKRAKEGAKEIPSNS